MLKAVSWLVVIAALSACKSGSTGTGGAAGTGVAGTGVAGTGIAGTGIAGAGIVAGTGVVAGTGAAGTSGGATAGCSAADKTVMGPALHAAVADLLTMQNPCGFSSCHTGNGKAQLTLMGKTDFHALLVGKPSCEAPSVMLVDGSGGDTALQKSWLWQKLTAPIDASGFVVADPSWGATPGTCGQTMGFGVRMPMTSLDVLDEPRLSKIRNWICGGAPGPQ